MNKKIIPIVLLLASSLTHAENNKNLPLNSKNQQAELVTKSLSSDKYDLPKIGVPYLAPLPKLPLPESKLFYKYSVNVEKLIKGNSNPILLFTSNGLGSEIHTSHFSNNQYVSYIKECTQQEGKEIICLPGQMRSGLTYFVNVFKPYNKLVYEVSVEIDFTEINQWKEYDFNNKKIEFPEIRVINMKQNFDIRQKTIVLKSTQINNNKTEDEYIFTITIEPTEFKMKTKENK